MSEAAAWIVLPLQIFLVDLLLGADNAVIIALVCRSLRPEDTRKAIVFGTAGAIVLRLVMATFANALLAAPLVKLIGAWTLIVIALNVRVSNDQAEEAMSRRASTTGDFIAAAAIITLADAAMSLDNVVALAAIARGNFWLLALGVAASIPILAYGSLMLAGLLRQTPLLVRLGAAMLGWIAGDMATSDALVASWIAANAPALAVVAPALGALFVFLNNGGPQPFRARRTRPSVAAPVPTRRPASPPPPARAQQDNAPERNAIDIEMARFPDGASDLMSEHLGPGGPVARTPEERIAIIGLIVLAFVAGIIIMVASYFDSLT